MRDLGLKIKDCFFCERHKKVQSDDLMSLHKYRLHDQEVSVSSLLPVVNKTAVINPDLSMGAKTGNRGLPARSSQPMKVEMHDRASAAWGLSETLCKSR